MEIISISAGARLSEIAKGLNTSRILKIMARTLNREARPVRTQVVNHLTHQTGLNRGVLVRAVREIRANEGSLTYTLATRGGFVRLKYFSPREGGGGITAYPRGEAHFYDREFLTSGLPGRRAPSPKLNGHVFEPLGRRWGGPIRVGRSDVAIPKEMLEGETVRSWRVTANRISDRVAAEVSRQILAGQAG